MKEKSRLEEGKNADKNHHFDPDYQNIAINVWKWPKLSTKIEKKINPIGLNEGS